MPSLAQICSSNDICGITCASVLWFHLSCHLCLTWWIDFVLLFCVLLVVCILNESKKCFPFTMIVFVIEGHNKSKMMGSWKRTLHMAWQVSFIIDRLQKTKGVEARSRKRRVTGCLMTCGQVECSDHKVLSTNAWWWWVLPVVSVA